MPIDPRPRQPGWSAGHPRWSIGFPIDPFLQHSCVAARDAFTIEIVKDKLTAAADEMGVVLARTSISPIVYEVLDFACSITDARSSVSSISMPTSVATATAR